MPLSSSRALSALDDACHPVDPDPAWSESWYGDFSDPVRSLHGWFRLGSRVNEGRSEVSACIHLPDGRAGVSFARPAIVGNGMASGGLSWEVEEPFRTVHVRFDGEVVLLPDGLLLADPGPALRDSPRARCAVALTMRGHGLGSVLGADQTDVSRIFLPGQADGHHQQLVAIDGTVCVGDTVWPIDGRGARDHSWGPRNWHAKRWFRWLTGAADDDFGFMLTRGASATHQRAGGFVWDDGVYRRVDRLEIRTELSAVERTPRRVQAHFGSGTRDWTVAGHPIASVPLRQRQGDAVLRIVKSPMSWVLDDAREAIGAAEHHDLMERGVPAGAPEWWPTAPSPGRIQMNDYPL